MSDITTKKIVILTSGYIRIDKLCIYGPVLTPYHEKITTIMKLLSDHVKVSEVLDDGTQLELNIGNFNTDNNAKNPKTEKKVEEPKKVEAPVQKEKEVVSKPVEKVKVEEKVTIEPVTESTDVKDTKTEDEELEAMIAEEENATAETTSTVENKSYKNKNKK